MFRLLFLDGATRSKVKTVVGLPPDFLSSLLALTDFVRLSLMKAAYADLFGAANRKSGSPFFFGPGTLVRTWGTRPIQPVPACRGTETLR
jgi:hypothetical protein